MGGSSASGTCDEAHDCQMVVFLSSDVRLRSDAPRVSIPLTFAAVAFGTGLLRGPSGGGAVMVLATSLISEAALRFVLLGLATGALTALVALAIVLVYRASGVLNFSAGAFGGIAAYYCYDIRDDVPTALAVAGGLVAGVLLGLLTFAVLSLLRECLPPGEAHRHPGAVQRRPGLHDPPLGVRGRAARVAAADPQRHALG